MSQSQIDLTVSQNEIQLAHPRGVLLNKRQWSYLKRRYQMTPREIQIAQLVCQGLGNEEIANRLKIKHGTVKTHVRNLYRKLWVHNKISMLLRFVEDTNGLLDKSAV
jgi:DNA-binding NarL/FixJ family response regulator